MCTPPPPPGGGWGGGGGGVELPTKCLKKGTWQEGWCNFYIKRKLKSEILNDKKV